MKSKNHSVPSQVKKLLDQFKPHARLDIGCGAHPQEGFIGIDIQKFNSPLIVQHDIETYPWPFPDECFELAMASHVAEHINPAKMGFIKWMNEVWRILEFGAKFMVSNPYGVSAGFIQDPTHINTINEHTWHYFDPVAPSGFYRFYAPAPWKIVQCAWDQNGFMETVLEKRKVDPSYGYRGEL